jgi:hypothetical protein
MSYYQDPYGTPSPYSGAPQYGYGVPMAPPTNGLAVAAMIVSIVSLVVCGGLTGPVGAIMGHVARRQVRDRGEQGDGFALAGIIIGWIATAIFAAIIIFYVLFFAAIFATAGSIDTPTYTPYPYSS